MQNIKQIKLTGDNLIPSLASKFLTSKPNDTKAEKRGCPRSVKFPDKALLLRFRLLRPNILTILSTNLPAY